MKRKIFKKIYSVVIIMLCFSIISNAQSDRRITGTIVAAGDGKPVEAATIQILPGNRSVLADANGKFSFMKENAKSIRISFVGYTSVSLEIGNKTDLSIK